MRTIFVSHSAKSPGDAAYLAAIVEGLEEAGFRVWVDRNALEGGDDWCLKIGNHLVCCDGAVVLVTARSLESHFVAHEVSNLLLRWARERDPETHEPTFALCPVIVTADAATLAKLDGGYWKAVGFSQVQHLRPADAADAVTKLVQRFSKLPDRGDGSPMAQVEATIAGILRGVPPEVLRAAVEGAGLRPPQPGPQDALHVARALLTATLAQASWVLDGIGASLLDEQRARILQLVEPAWVSHEAALRLEDVIRSRRAPEPGTAAAPLAAVCVINGERIPFTPEMYVRRARHQLPEVAPLVVEATARMHGDRGAEQLAREFRARVAERVRLARDPGDDGFDEQLQARIQQLLRVRRRPIVVTFPAEASDLDTVAAVADEGPLRGVTFVALLPGASAAISHAGVRFVEPELQPDQEWRAFETFDVLHQADQEPPHAPARDPVLR